MFKKKPKCHAHIFKRNLYKPNLLFGTNICAWNRQVFGILQIKLAKISFIETLFNVQFII